MYDVWLRLFEKLKKFPIPSGKFRPSCVLTRSLLAHLLPQRAKPCNSIDARVVPLIPLQSAHL